MESTIIKKTKLSVTVNIIVSVTSLIYLIVAIVYFVAMTVTATTGNEYDMLGVVFGFIFLPVALGILLIPIFRIITLILSLSLNKKAKNGEKAGGLCTATGVLQIIDAVVAPLIIHFVSLLPWLLVNQGDSAVTSLAWMLDLFLFAFAVTKSVFQIISASALFKIKKMM